MRRLLLLALAVAACNDVPVSRRIGARCDDSDECDQRCLLPSASYPGGMCTVLCDDDRDCPADTRCVDDEGGVCLYGCVGDPDCAFLGAGWTCQTLAGQPGGQVTACRGA